MMDVVVIEAIKQMQNLFVVFLREVGIIAQYRQRIMNEFLHQTVGHGFQNFVGVAAFLNGFFGFFKLHHTEGVGSFLKTQNLRNGGASRHPALKFIDFGFDESVGLLDGSFTSLDTRLNDFSEIVNGVNVNFV